MAHCSGQWAGMAVWIDVPKKNKWMDDMWDHVTILHLKYMQT
jgi:hypothetical protein